MSDGFKTGIKVQNESRSRVRPATFDSAVSDRRALTSRRFHSATSRALPTVRASRRRRWSYGLVHSLAPEHGQPFGPYGAPRPRQSARPTPRARPRRELSGLSFAL